MENVVTGFPTTLKAENMKSAGTAQKGDDWQRAMGNLSSKFKGDHLCLFSIVLVFQNEPLPTSSSQGIDPFLLLDLFFSLLFVFYVHLNVMSSLASVVISLLTPFCPPFVSACLLLTHIIYPHTSLSLSLPSFL